MKSMLTLTLLAALTTGAFASPVIDTFGTPTALTTSTGATVSVATDCGATCIGGSRELSVTRIAGTGQSQVEVAGDTFMFSNTTRTAGTATIRWDGVANGSDDFGLAANLLNSVIQVNTLESDGNFSYSITLWDSANKYSTVVGRAASVGDGPGYFFSAPHTFQFASNWFSTTGTQANPVHILNDISNGFGFPIFIDAFCATGGCVDLTNVKAISATIDQFGERRSLDLTLGTVQTVSSVPEPSSVALFLAGLGAVGFVSFRKKQDQTE